jgi:hypothetical protein
MKTFCSFILIISCIGTFSQQTSNVALIKKQLFLKENKIYIFCRGTRSKSRLIAEKFNKKDTNITHVAIGFMNKSSLLIYNVSDNYISNNALRIDSLESFIGSADVYFFSVWKCNIDISGFNKIKKSCEEYSKKRIFFDASFNISDNDTLYCSEFCVNVLKKVNRKDFVFEPELIQLNNKLYESILKREYLSYFPVDFFQSNKHFTKLFEYRFVN